jgi:hypothetical protein
MKSLSEYAVKFFLMENSYRKFPDHVERLAESWRLQTVIDDPWTPKGNDRKDVSLENCSFVEKEGLGAYVKRLGRRHSLLSEQEGREMLGVEKIVADLAYDLGVPSAPGCLWRPDPEQPDKIWYLSLNPLGQDGETFSEVKSYLTQRFNEASGANLPAPETILRNAADQNTAMWVFSLWTGDWSEHSSRHDNILFSYDHGVEESRLSSIDHADAKLAFEEPLNFGIQRDYMGPFNGGKQSSYEAGRTIPAPPIDVQAARDMLERIRRYDPAKLRAVIDRIPESLMSRERKDQAINGLLSSIEKTASFVERFIEKVQSQPDANANFTIEPKRRELKWLTPKKEI